MVRMLRANLRRSSFECTDRTTGMESNCSAGSVQMKTAVYQAITTASRASPIHSHDVAYGDGPPTNRSTSSGPGDRLGHLDQPRSDLSAAAVPRVRNLSGGHELTEFARTVL